MIKKLNVHPYPKKVWLIWEELDSNVMYEFSKEPDDYSGIYSVPPTSEGETIRTKKGNVVIRFHTAPTNPGSIAHEAFHAVTNILDYIGMKLSDESEEAYSYLLDSIVSQIHETITTQ